MNLLYGIETVKGAYINDQDVTYDPLPERIEHDNFFGAYA